MQTGTSFIHSAEAAKSITPAAVHAHSNRNVMNATVHIRLSNICFKMSTCYKCQKQGHIAKACRSQKSVSTAASHGSGTGSLLAARYRPGQPGSPYQNHQMQDLVSSYPKIMMRHQEGPARDVEADFNLFTLISASHAPINLPIKINGPLVEFQLDTGK